MNHDQRASTSSEIQEHQEDSIRDIYALTPIQNPRSSALSVSSSDGVSNELIFSTMSREFNALVLAGSTIDNNNLESIGEYEMHEETNRLAIVADNNHLSPLASSSGGGGGGISVRRVKKEEVETKISAWQNAKISKVNNRFKREEAIINGWESEQVQKSTSWMKKVERKVDEKRAKGLEKMENDIAKAHRKAEERRASAEAKRGTKVAKLFEIANFMRALGRPPSKRSFF